MHSRLTLLFLAGSLAAPCSSAVSAAPPATTSLRTVARGTQSPAAASSRQVIRDKAAWSRLWTTQLRPEGSEAETPPAVDFSREMVLAVFQGQKSSGGYAVTILSAKEEKGALLVTVREQSPPPDAMSIQVLTSPYHVVAVKRSKLPVKWKVVRKP